MVTSRLSWWEYPIEPKIINHKPNIVMIKCISTLVCFILFISFILPGPAKAQSVDFFKQKLSGLCIQFSHTSGNSHGWTYNYTNTYHCPSGNLQVHQVQLIESAYTTSQSRKDFQFTGTWEIIDRGNGQKQVFYRLNSGNTKYIDISTDAYQQLFFGMAWSHCGQAQCY